MATRAQPGMAIDSERRFFFIMAVVMALVLVTGFSIQLAAGRSTFHAPLLVHLHALLFFGWTFFYVLQNGLAATGSVALHKRLGWLSAVWVPMMVVVGIATTTMLVRKGHAPFFFEPLDFLLMNSLSILTFAGLVTGGIMMRRRTLWHRRLIYCGMALLTGPGLGRILPMPFLIPYADWAVFGAVMLFPLIGVVADIRRAGSVHPAWVVGIAAMTCFQLLFGVIAHSPIGLLIYGVATSGSPGAAIAPLAYPPLPPL